MLQAKDNNNGYVPLYSIIVPAYNEAEELPATLQSLRIAMDKLEALGELVVVDNNSTDATAHVASENGANTVVFESINQIARARNTGAAKASGDYFIFVDADTRIEPELLQEAVKRMQQQDVGGGAVVEFEGTISLVGRFGIETWKRISLFMKIAAGSFLFCRRTAFESIGGFDEKLYASEEVRFSRLLKRYGKKQGLGFSIIAEPPVKTSARKLQWYSGLQILAWIAFLAIMPIAVRSRRLCGFWYNRPNNKTL